MPTRDIFHDAVRRGLEKEGWTITDDPLTIQVGNVEMYIDLGAEKLLAAERNGEKIAVEIKAFVSPSNMYEFHLAIGQYRNYRLALAQEESERRLYLAVPIEIYEDFFSLQFVRESVRYNEILLLVYDAEEEEIVQWIS